METEDILEVLRECKEYIEENENFKNEALEHHPCRSFLAGKALPMPDVYDQVVQAINHLEDE